MAEHIQHAVCSCHPGAHASIEAKAKQYSTSGSTVHVIYHTIPPSHTQKACVSLHGNMARTLASKV